MQNSSVQQAQDDAELVEASNCKMFTHLNFQRKFWRARNEILKFKILRYEKETPEIIAQIYSFGKGPDSPGSFRFERTRKVN